MECETFLFFQHACNKARIIGTILKKKKKVRYFEIIERQLIKDTQVQKEKCVAKSFQRKGKRVEVDTKIKCYKCNTHGHKSNEYPKRKFTQVCEYEEKHEQINPYYCALVGGTSSEKKEDSRSEEEYFRVLHKLVLTTKKTDESHRNHLFKICCFVRDEVCNVIIDGRVSRIS